MADKLITFEIYHKPITGEYFRGSIIKANPSFSRPGEYQIVCEAVSGGNKKFSVLDLLGYTGSTKKELLGKVKYFAKKWDFKYHRITFRETAEI